MGGSKRKRNSKAKVKWLTEPRLRVKGETYYESCSVDDITYSVGDVVEVKVASESRTEMATIVCLWKESSIKYFAEVRYYMKMCRLSKTILSHLPSDLHDKVCETDQMDEIQLDWICGPAENVQDSHYLYSVFTKILKPVEPGLTRQERSLHLFSERARQHPQLISADLPEPEPIAELCKLDAIKRLKSVCQRLQLSSVPKELPCRENEKTQIFDYLRHAIAHDSQNPLYCYGLQGLGNTATVMQVLRELAEQRDNGLVGNFQVIHVNGMKLPKAEMVYSEMWRAITKHRGSVRTLSPTRSCEFLTKIFNTPQHDRPVLILIVDEMDCILNRSNTVLYNLLDWPRKPNAKLVVIGIANTMDLPEQLESKLDSRFGVHRIQFQPYSSEQIEAIIKDRIGEFDVFDSTALSVHAKKIALRSGDIRMALNLCQSAAEKCLTRLKSSTSTDVSKMTVSLRDINAAMSTSSVSPQVVLLRTLRPLECVLIAAIVCEAAHRKTDEVPMEPIFDRMTNMARTRGLTVAVSIQRVLEISDSLDQSRIIRCHRQELTRYPLVRLNLGISEVVMAWKSHSLGQSLLPESIIMNYS